VTGAIVSSSIRVIINRSCNRLGEERMRKKNGLKRFKKRRQAVSIGATFGLSDEGSLWVITGTSGLNNSKEDDSFDRKSFDVFSVRSRQSPLKSVALHLTLFCSSKSSRHKGIRKSVPNGQIFN
jgi:hypothetical protein